jgi:hypothetical protein
MFSIATFLMVGLPAGCVAAAEVGEALAIGSLEAFSHSGGWDYHSSYTIQDTACWWKVAVGQ